MPEKKKEYVVITTAHRGVFAGYQEGEKSGYTTLSEARMCVYWDTATKGVLGLASTGPTNGCRVTRSVPEVKIPTSQVTAVMSVSDAARERWEKGPWS